MIKRLLVMQSFWIGLSIRLLVAWLLPMLMDGRGGVDYTDIDFYVYGDAADHIRQGGSPFDRTTYRYTPFLAVLLAKLPSREWGRHLFCVADALCGWMIQEFRRRSRLIKSSDSPLDASWSALLQSPGFHDALWWLYNPLSINICTRGSAEPLVLLPVLVTVWLISRFPRTLSTAVLAGLAHGVAVHAKLYPIIYSLSLAVALSPPSPTLLGRIKSLFTPVPIVFGLVAVSTFAGLTWVSYVWYGPMAVEEGLLYHFSRVDHRHNYSMHWYWIYLARGSGQTTPWVGRLLLVPQAVLLLVSSLCLEPLSMALFVQTFLFVANNKVITAQYFTWYLCLLPLCSDLMGWTRRVKVAVAMLLGSVVFWLGSAYCLELQRMAVHRLVWFASVVVYLANVNLLTALLASTAVVRDKDKRS